MKPEGNLNNNQIRHSFHSLSNGSNVKQSLEIDKTLKRRSSSIARVHKIETTTQAANFSSFQASLANTHSLNQGSQSQGSTVVVHRLSKASSLGATKQSNVRRSLDAVYRLNQIHHSTDRWRLSQDEITISNKKWGTTSLRERVLKDLVLLP